jgi:hypothetical protein
MRRTFFLLSALALVGASCAPDVESPSVEGTSAHAAFFSPYVGWTAASGQPSASLGMSLAGGGDVNDDGWEDVLVGIPGFDDGQESEGTAFLYLGNGTNFEPTHAWQYTNDEAYSFFGSDVTFLGDISGDGYDDVAVGAPADDGVVAVNAGAVRVFCGHAVGLSMTPCWVGLGNQLGGSFGFTVEGGDVNGDGFGDLIVGAPDFDGEAGVDEGAVFVYHGGVAGLPILGASTIVYGGTEFARFGYDVASGGNVDGDADGYEDVLVSEPDFSDGEGRVRLFLGSADGMSETDTWSYASGAPLARLGHSVDIAGDTNGDGFDDLIIGVPWFDDLAPDQGQALVFFGSDSGIAEAPDWIFLGLQTGGLAGAAVAGVGDLDGDGTADVIVAASHAEFDQPYQGQILAFPGALGIGPSIFPGKVLTNPNETSYSFFGSALAPAGDVNDDGYDDFVVGAWANSVGAGLEGTAMLLYGTPALADVDDDGFCADPAGCPGDIPGGDCNDLDPGIFPGAEETCDGVDQDCDGSLPANEQDLDGDGFMPCEGDCDDSDAATNPGADEICDEIDHDCDGLIDNGVVPPRYWPDGDGDGYGNPLGTPIQSCSDPGSDYAPNSGDCDDEAPGINPGQDEITCTGIDEDCTFLTPDVPDRDGDAFTPCEDCQLLGTTLQCGDCDDTDQEINPYMAETCQDGIDQDCDGEDPDCAIPPECDRPDNICTEFDCDCSTVSTEAGRPALLLLLLLLPILRRRAAR